MALYNATDGPNWRNNTNWLSDKPVGEWHGVTTNDTGRVTRLELAANKLTGEIPAELGGLTNLNHMDLSANELTGEIPAELGNLGSLEWLELGSNKLSGEIPPELGNLPNLRVLRLYLNELTGKIPTELGNLSNLEELILHENQLTGEIPSQLGSLSNLEELKLGSNQLTGEIPSQLGSLSNLNFLNLNGNQLTGEIPTELGNLSNLRTLWLYGNQLTGCIPPALRDVPNNDLDRLGLRFCSVSSPGAPTVDAVAPGTGSLTISWTAPSDHGGSVITAYDLRHIETSDDETVDSNWAVVDDVWTTGGGTLQYTLTGLTAGTQYDLQIRAVNAGGDGTWSATITGTTTATGTPTSATDREILIALYNATDGANWTNNTNWLSDEPLGDWHGVTTDDNGRVTWLGLYENQLSGEIPPELGNLSNLTWLYLYQNQLSGNIPPELGNLSNLTDLYLSENQLSGEIPSELGNLSNLTRLDLWGNQLSGEIPPELGSLSNLTWLRLNENQLSGEIPPEFGSLSDLTNLELGYNQLSGSIPSELGSFSNLTGLYLSGNQLSGEIPSELGSLSNLTGLSLDNNQLTGAIPPELGNLSNLTWLSLSWNQLSGEIPPELGNLSNLVGLYLAGNRLCVPESIRVQFAALSRTDIHRLPDCTVEFVLTPQLLNDNVFVLPVEGEINAASVPLKRYAKRFYEFFHDSFDFLIFVSNLSLYELGTEGFKLPYAGAYASVMNDTNGIGQGMHSDHRLWGSEGTLQGVVLYELGTEGFKLPYAGGVMNDTNDWAGDADHRLWGSEGTLQGVVHLGEIEGILGEIVGISQNILLHELMHRWANFILSFEEMSPNPGPHWGFSSANGLLGGFDIADLVDHGNGRYSAGRFAYDINYEGDHKPYSPIELYLAGLVPPEDVPDLWVAEDGKWLEDESPTDRDWLFTASKFRTYTIEDIIRQHGERIPDSSQSQRDFRAAVILLIDEDHPLTKIRLNQVSGGITLFSHAGADEFDAYNFYEATGGRATITMDCLSQFLKDNVAATSPCRPRDFTTSESGLHSIDLSWSAPESDGGSVITAYDLRYIETAADETVDSNWTVVDDVWTTGGGSLQYTLTGLTGGTQYDLQIRAVNAVGDGPWSGTATGTPTTAGDRIAFQSNRDGNWEIYVMNADGSGVTNLTNNSDHDVAPAWSPDGKRIAFRSDRDGNWEIYVMNADGSGVTRLTNDSARDSSPAWSPDGRRIAFRSDRDGNWEIYVMNADGSGVTNLTNDSASDDFPGWSPDGKRIAFDSDRDGNREIYVMNADGSGVTRLTNDSASDNSPAWSPEGRRIAFESYRDGNWEVYVMNTDGSGVTNLTNAHGIGPNWSPEGRRITFRSDRDGNFEIYVMNADGSGVANLTNDSALDINPAWSPAAGLSDRDILIALYNATGGPNWLINTNWLSNEPLQEWHGVTTDADGRVATLDLTENWLSGRMPSQLGDLSSLGELRLANNHLSGPIPPELGRLSALTRLDLENNDLSGSYSISVGRHVRYKGPSPRRQQPQRPCARTTGQPGQALVSADQKQRPDWPDPARSGPSGESHSPVCQR